MGASPAVLWTLFSLLYYGSIVPNTAYAKLGAGVPLIDSIKQGWLYYKNSFELDPVTLWTITLGILVGLISKPIDRCLSLGVVLYLVYILAIGGDFMSGRFFTVPLVASMVVLAGNGFKKPVIAVFLIGYGCVFCKTSVLKHEVVGIFSAGGIADERLFWYGRRNFMSWKRLYPHYETAWEEYANSSLPKRVIQTCGGMGYQGLEGGPALHLVDACGLADPLLARLPARPHQRVGHYHRIIPTNYELSAYSGRNMLIDDDLKSYYDYIRLVTRGSLFDVERLKTVVRLLVEKTPDLSRWGNEMTVAKHTSDAYVTVTADQLVHGSTEGRRWDNRDSTVIYGAGLEVVFSAPEQISVIDIVVDNNDLYRIEYFDGGEFKPLFAVGPSSDPAMAPFIPNPVPFGMTRYKRTVPIEVSATTRIRITPEAGDGMYSVGCLVTREQ
jgi:arabinofuranosyltransferase